MPTDSAATAAAAEAERSGTAGDALVFATQDLGRDLEPAPADDGADLGFAVLPRPAAAAGVRGDSPWTVLDAGPPAPAAPPSRHGWATRRTVRDGRSTQDIILRLREEAVDMSWKSAWIAVTAADARLVRRRDSRSS